MQYHRREPRKDVDNTVKEFENMQYHRTETQKDVDISVKGTRTEDAPLKGLLI